MKVLIGDQETLYNANVQIRLPHLDLQLLPNTSCNTFVLRIAKRKNVAVFSARVLQLGLSDGGDRVSHPSEKDDSAENSARSISRAVPSWHEPTAFLGGPSIL